MRIAICDDERETAQRFAEKARNAYPEAEIILYASGNELLLADEPMDILFLDIQMDGKNGMETARELRKRKNSAVIIFITAMEDYVFEAFDVEAFNYLVKPFDEERFMQVLQSAVEKCNERNVMSAKMTEVSEIAQPQYIMVKSGRAHIKIQTDKIIYAEIFDRKILIHKTDGDVEYYGKMSELEKMLDSIAHGDFFRPHRAYLVNLKYVEKYNITNIWLERGTVIMAKKNYPLFVKMYLKYNQKCNGK